MVVRVLVGALALTLGSVTSSVVNGIVDFTKDVGDFHVSWGVCSSHSYFNAGAHCLEVYHASDTKAVWSSVPNVPFVSAADGEWTPKSNEGAFQITDKISRRTTTQSITEYDLSSDKITLKGALSGEGMNADYTISLVSATASRLQMVVDVNGIGADRMFLTYACDKDERFYGFGIQYSYLNAKGRDISIMTREQGVGRGREPLTKIVNLNTKYAGGSWDTTYGAVPYYLTSKYRSVFLHNSEYSKFHLTHATTVDIQLQSLHMEVSVLGGHSYPSLIKEYTEYTGRMTALPDWAMGGGAVIGMEGGTDAVYAMWEKMKSAGVPVAGFWVQDWSGVRKDPFGTRLWWNWEVDTETYHNWEKLLGDLYEGGVRLFTYINPFVANGVSESHHVRRDLFKEADAAGYLLKNSANQTYILASGSPNFTFGTVDMTNPEGREWWKEVIKCNMLCVCASSSSSSGATCGNGGSFKVPVGGFMSDFGEYTPYDAVFHNGDSGHQQHNLYPEQWAELVQEAVEEAGLADDTVYFARSAYTKSPGRSKLMWMGDQLVTWDAYDGMASALTGYLTSGLSGFSNVQSDVGGYTMLSKWGIKFLRSEELLNRWGQMSAFADAMFRTHPGNMPDVSAQVWSSEATMASLKRYASLHQHLFPYRKELMLEAEATGMPHVRPMFLQYPQITGPAADSMVQYMLGPDLLVAPVLATNITSLKVYLPTDKWVHLWTGKVFAGGLEATEEGEEGNQNGNCLRVEVGAPADEIPVFYRSGSKVGESLRKFVLEKGWGREW